MSVVNEFSSKSVKINEADKIVYIIDESQFRGVFHYHILCRGPISPSPGYNAMFLFNMETSKMLVMSKLSSPHYQCSITSFWVINDEPVPAATWLFGQKEMMVHIRDSFKDQHAAYILDKVING